jgi:hypothetical protein
MAGSFAAFLQLPKPERRRHRSSRSARGLPPSALSTRLRMKQIKRYTLSIVETRLAVETELFAQPPAIETIDMLT